MISEYNGTEDLIKYQAQLASMAETSDGWMMAYYRQTNRLLRLEAELQAIADNGHIPAAIRLAARSVLREVQE
jgi:hypothetical protein